jgi:nucleotide-binding universal stress UspA family protein
MNTSVLCAIDISNTGKDDNVLKAAKRIADLDGAQLDVMTVVPNYGASVVGSFFGAEHHATLLDEAKAALKQQCRDSLGEADTGVRHVVATGTAYEEILKVAAETECTVIVIGAHKPDYKDYLLGPNAARVVRHSDCSVYVVR